MLAFNHCLVAFQGCSFITRSPMTPKLTLHKTAHVWKQYSCVYFVAVLPELLYQVSTSQGISELQAAVSLTFLLSIIASVDVLTTENYICFE